MALDVSPDGDTIAFDLLGEIYTLDRKGGAARPLLAGSAFETQPVFSPDGRQIAFLSDRSGAKNLWVADADGSNARQISNDTGPAIYSSPAWSWDGRFIYVSRTVHTLLAFELFAYDLAGGSGIRVTNARPAGTESWDERLNSLGAAVSPDGRQLYFSRKAGSLWSEQALPHWNIVRRNLATGAEETIVTAPGGAMRPALSHDGTKLIYASRRGQQTGLRLRNLKTGADRWLTFPIDPDTQLGGYYNDLVPRVDFLPGDEAVLTAIGGKIFRIDLSSGVRTPIPFTASVDLPIAPNTRVEVPDETGSVRVRVIQAPRLSPDNRRVAFAALGRLYLQDLRASDRPVPVRGVEGMAFQPSWSPDGRSLAYVTWDASEGGHVWTIAAGGGSPRRLTRDAAFYSEPVFSPDGRSVAVLRASQFERVNAPMELSPSYPTDVITIPASGGAAKHVVREAGARSLSWNAEGDGLRFRTGTRLVSVSLEDPAVRTILELKVPNPNRYEDFPVAPEDARLSPDGKYLLAKSASQLYLVAVPPTLGADAQGIDLARPAVGVARLTNVGADYLGWSADGKGIVWSVGSTIRSIGLERALALGRDAEQEATLTPAVVELPRDVPSGTLVLRGGTAITMRGDETIADADVVVTEDRIVAVGPSGSIPLPAGAEMRDVRGKFIVPGFIDTHAHWFELRREILDLNHWGLLANLAYGVTSGLEVQSFTIDVFGYQDMIDAGMMPGPRAFSTGPGIFMNSEINSLEDARTVLRRYRDHYRTRNVKSYMIGNRAQRQYVAQAAAELGMMPTTEGASDLHLNLTHALDGFAGNEHSLPVSPIREDVVKLYAETRIGYTPTLGVLYGGRSPVPNLMMDAEAISDPKLRRFIPPGIVETKFRDLTWTPPYDRTSARFAADALRIREAGGLVGMGSHALVQGLAYHWELEVYGSGGATPYQVLRAATIDSAEVIGRKSQLGSLEPGKYADLLVLNANPLKDIKNTQSLDLVMKNGRLYDAGTLAEEWPRRTPPPHLWFRDDEPPIPAGSP